MITRTTPRAPRRSVVTLRSWSPLASIALSTLVACSSSPSPGSASGGSSNTGGSVGAGGAGGGSAGTAGSSGNAAGGAAGSGGGGGQSGGAAGSNGTYSSVKVYQSSRAGDVLAESTLALVSAGSSTRPAVALDGTQRQEVIGFGTSFTEASATVLEEIPDRRDEILNELFSPEKANFTLTRTHMGSCDFTVKGNYTYTAPDAGNLNAFSIDVDRGEGTPGTSGHRGSLIKFIKDSMAIAGEGRIKIVSTPWTAPPWMKTNDAFVDGQLDAAHRGDFAQFFVKYAQAYEAEGIPIWGFTPINEPEHLGQWETMGMSGAEEATFIGDHLGPALEAAGMGDKKILGFDHNKGTSLVSYATSIYNDPEAAPHTDGMAHHWYGSTTSFLTDSFDQVHTMAPDKLMIAAEQSIDSFPPVVGGVRIPSTEFFGVDSFWWAPEKVHDWCFQTGWTCGQPADHPRYTAVFRVIEDILGGLNHWQNGWIDWNPVLNDRGGPNWANNATSAPIMVHQTSKEVYYTPLFTAMKHFSKWILPGARVIGNSVDASTGLLATAATNPDSSLAIVVFNKQDAAVDYQITTGGQAVELQIPAAAVQTIVLR